MERRTRKAVLLVEAANLLLMPGRKVAKAGEKAENPEVELGPEQIEALINKDRPSFVKLAKGISTDCNRTVEGRG
jgi:hypothetical protein